MHNRLFTPGPTEVRPEILQRLATPQIHHRSPQCLELYAEIQPKLQRLLYTKNPVFLFTSSSTGAMEAAVTNLVEKRCLNLVNGAFSERWHEITTWNRVPCDRMDVDWSQAIKPEMVDRQLASGAYDAVTLVYNETSTGLANPLAEIATVVNSYHDVHLLVDAVSAMAGVKIETDKLGIDFLLAGTQKAFALPAGIAVAAMSERALARAERIEPRNYYFNLKLMYKYHLRNQTPSTPSIPHMYALNAQLDDILSEGLEKRFTRHRAMAKRVQSWAEKYFAIYPEQGYWSQTLTCIANTRQISVADLVKTLIANNNVRIANGYGALKEKTFRIAHMGDTQIYEIDGVLAAIEDILRLR
ncbi:alanine--glyoxylate aminotransferase family protein [Candidatus Bipolaricaulota bacterium]|nr:alanine--glyoxylate aminotransferase family protein [Candidatus Bipolaricaulota bacterium]